MKIKIREERRIAKGREYKAFVATVNLLGGGRKRFVRASKSAAYNAALEFSNSEEAKLVIPSELSQSDIEDARKTFILLRKMGVEIPLFEVVKNHCGLFANGVVLKTATVAEAVKTYLADLHRRTDKKINSHYKATRSVLKNCLVVPFGDLPITGLTSDHLRAHLERTKLAPATQNGVIARVGMALNWMQKNNYLRFVPTLPEKVRYVYKEPTFLPVENAERLFLWLEQHGCEPEKISVLAIWFFAGVRLEEIKRMSVEHINLEEAYLRVAIPKGATRGIMPRVVHLEDNLIAWLRAFPFKGWCGWTVTEWYKWLRSVETNSGIDLPNNVGRHSYATFHVAAFGNPRNTELNMGTSATMRQKNYMGLVTKVDGVRYFGIMPNAKETASADEM